MTLTQKLILVVVFTIVGIQAYFKYFKSEPVEIRRGQVWERKLGEITTGGKTEVITERCLVIAANPQREWVIYLFDGDTLETSYDYFLRDAHRIK